MKTKMLSSPRSQRARVPPIRILPLIAGIFAGCADLPRELMDIGKTDARIDAIVDASIDRSNADSRILVDASNTDVGCTNRVQSRIGCNTLLSPLRGRLSEDPRTFLTAGILWFRQNGRPQIVQGIPTIELTAHNESCQRVGDPLLIREGSSESFYFHEGMPGAIDSRMVGRYQVSVPVIDEEGRSAVQVQRRRENGVECSRRCPLTSYVSRMMTLSLGQAPLQIGNLYIRLENETVPHSDENGNMYYRLAISHERDAVDWRLYFEGFSPRIGRADFGDHILDAEILGSEQEGRRVQFRVVYQSNCLQPR